MCLIQVLIMTFQEQPPVYAIPQAQQQALPSMQQPLPPYPTPYPQQSYSPYPPMGGMPMPMPMSGGAIAQPPQQSQSAAATPTFNFRPSLISAGEEKVRRRLEDAYLSTEIIKTV